MNVSILIPEDTLSIDICISKYTLTYTMSKTCAGNAI